MRDPYRSVLVPPERHDAYWRAVERHGATRKRLPKLLFALGMLPALAALTSVAIGKAAAKPPTPVLEKALAEPWGLVISRESIEPLTGTGPSGAPLPDRAASPIAARDLQRALAEHAKEFQRCYDDEARFLPELEGDLIVSIALRGGYVESVLTGKKSLRGWVGSCIRSAVGRIEFPSTHGEVAWVHYPMRFVSTQPPSHGAGNTSM